MKKMYLLILLVLGYKVSVCQYTGSISTSQNDLVMTQSIGYDVIRIPNCSYPTQLGAPQLPVLYKKYVLPYDAEVSGISVTSVTKTGIPGYFNVFPVQPQHRTNGQPTEFVEPISEIYQSTTPYPNKVSEISEVFFFMDYKIVTVAFFPIEYQPDTKKLYLYENINFTINYTINPIPYIFSQHISLTGKHLVQALVAGCVENPTDVVLVSGGVNNVPDSEASQFFPIPDQYPTNLGVDPEYIIITNNALKASFQEEFIKWKNQKGIPVLLATLEDDILKKYNGCDTAHKIRNFIADMQDKFGPGKLILLGGDINIIPTRMALCNAIESPCDSYYSSIDLNDFANWNENGNNIYGEPCGIDNVKDIPSNFLGRIPVRTADDVSAYTHKVLEYETLKNYNTGSLIDPGFRNQILEMVGSSSVGSLFWKDHVTTYVNNTNNIPFGSTMQALMLTDNVEYNLNQYITEAELNKARAITELDKSASNGYNICFHFDHSGPATMGTSYALKGESLIIPDVDALNSNHFGNIILSAGCETNRFNEHSISKAFLNHPFGGSLVYIGKSVSTGGGFVETGQFLHEVFYNNSTQLNHAGTYFANKFQIGTPPNGLSDRRQFNMLGDAELPIWKNEPPLPLTISTIVTELVTGPNTFSITINNLPNQQDARLCVSKLDEVYFLDQNIMGTGNTITKSVTIEPKTTTGFVDIVVSAKNYLPVTLHLPVNANPDPYLYMVGDPIIDDYSAGTIGNGDGQLDAGETVKISITIENSGQMQSGSIQQATLVPVGSPCTVLNASAFPNVTPGGQAVSIQPFKVHVNSTNVLDQSVAVFRLILPVQSYPSCTTYIRIPLHTPKLKIYTLKLETSNGNSTIEPGDIVNLYITIKNEGSGKISGIQSSLSCGPYLQILNSTSTYPDIIGYTQAENIQAYQFHAYWNPPQPSPQLLVNLSILPAFGPSWTFPGIDLTPPPKTSGLKFTSTPHSINLWWEPVANIKPDQFIKSKQFLSNA